MILDNLDRPNITQGSLKVKEGSRREREVTIEEGKSGKKDSVRVAGFKIVQGSYEPWNVGRWPLEAEKDKETDSPLEPLGTNTTWPTS